MSNGGLSYRHRLHCKAAPLQARQYAITVKQVCKAHCHKTIGAFQELGREKGQAVCSLTFLY